MGSQEMISSLIVPRHLINLFNMFVMFLIFPTSNCSDECSGDISYPTGCGKFSDIGYPFWGEQLRPKYCGHPDFELRCPESSDKDGHLVLILAGYSYNVLDIDSSDMKIELLPSDYCRLTQMDEVDRNLHKYKASFDNITSYYNCKHMDHMESFDFVTCSNDDVEYRYYWQGDKVLLNKSCKYASFPSIKLNYSHVFDEACGWVYSSSTNAIFVCPHTSTGDWKLILSIAIPVALIILIVLAVGLFYLRRHKLYSKPQWSRTTPYDHIGSDLEVGSSFFGIPVFSYIELQEATNNFDPDRILGDGGFGIVYHGKLRDGREVAVKRLYERNYKRVGQFMNEVEILTKLKHPNLVTLYGCTSRHSRELLLVYDYIPNGTVADHLHGDRSDSSSLTWNVRMKIAIQTADALLYLHASEFVHRDVKTNNILLDNYFSVKVADFGLSRLFPLDATHVSTAPQGTPGYLDPEYRKYYQVTCKSDVYSFGVVLVELISSLPAIDISREESDINLSTYAMNKIQQGALDELVDKKLGFDSDFKVKRMVTLVAELAFQCLQQEKEIRPSMEEVLQALKRIDSMDYEALEAEEMNHGFQISKQGSGVVKREVKQTSRNYQYRNSSPKSVIVGWASSRRSTVSNNSGSG